MVNKITGIFVILAFTLFHDGVKGGVYHDPANEAVVIDDTVIFDPDNFDPPKEEDVTTLRPEGYCTTAGGGPGTCIPLRECFPYADMVMRENSEDDSISGYIREVINATLPCASEENSEYVCCPSYSYQKLPAKRPSILPQFPTPTTVLPPTTTGKGVEAEENGNVTKTNSTSAEPNKNKESCGSFLMRTETDDYVVGGRFAQRGEFPWAVAITDNGRQFCGGSLIKNNFVLTAAHCVQPLRNAAGVRVLIGAHNLGNPTEQGRESRTLSKILYHRDFSMRHLANDVALLQLSTPVTYSKYIQPICLNMEELSYTEKVDLAGWGKTGNNAPPSKTLKTVNMALISPETCKQRYRGTNAPPLTSGMICAGESVPLKDACNGDSGGPLTLKTGETAKQVGIVSWGIGCGEKPGVYTKVSQYMPWITKNSK